ncbi:MAG: DegQ family serine endoprotease [Gammaproteobacteria bacterium]|nr:DegQ family serine endoprotease [Gammaproteobacteria bacterium]
MAAPPVFAATNTGLPDFTALVTANSPAVVNISTSESESTSDSTTDKPRRPEFSIPNAPDNEQLNEFFRRFFGDQMPEGPGGIEPRASLGSGFIISKDGYVISNYHVIKDADEVVVRLSDRRELPAKIIGTDPRSDIAVLKVESKGDLPVLRLGSSDELKVGEWVLAIGSPFGFDHSVTAGIVSAKGRSLPNENYVPFIQTDVAINPGNSGGPLFNLEGEVVGVNSQIFSRTGGFMGLSFAIPIDVVMNVYAQLRDKGAVSRGWLGVLIQDVTGELAESFHMTTPRGALVSKVLPDSPAEKAGVEAGDIITKFDGHSIETSSDLPPLVGSTQVRQKIPTELIRESKSQKIIITIGELPQEDVAQADSRPEPTDKAKFDTRLKIRVRDLTAAERKATDLASSGIAVEAVKPGPAEAAGLLVGDIILQINFKETKSATDLFAITKELQPGAKVPLLVHRQGSPLFMALELPK